MAELAVLNLVAVVSAVSPERFGPVGMYTVSPGFRASSAFRSFLRDSAFSALPDPAG
eukprot:CAMPEP_0196698522 /NCGR_PEP_ID=MMETSP1090-20130531/44774_1 /TAXON_ID=37098 /ORGANISM="Isochrysis sp, Strain CCMP1244" /LENGTH=56 /DNA_ID=CAMNT_0042038185 /DNA_START=187 /DNA_END=358 /DNA_ORIENTATION=+